jgi:hypothetical protein
VKPDYGLTKNINAAMAVALTANGGGLDQGLLWNISERLETGMVLVQRLTIAWPLGWVVRIRAATQHQRGLELLMSRWMRRQSCQLRQRLLKCLCCPDANNGPGHSCNFAKPAGTSTAASTGTSRQHVITGAARGWRYGAWWGLDEDKASWGMSALPKRGAKHPQRLLEMEGGPTKQGHLLRRDPSGLGSLLKGRPSFIDHPPSTRLPCRKNMMMATAIGGWVMQSKNCLLRGALASGSSSEILIQDCFWFNFEESRLGVNIWSVGFAFYSIFELITIDSYISGIHHDHRKQSSNVPDN